jgi:acyl-coenzyme A synthetase/AMP-(fatty) acid ligase
MEMRIMSRASADTAVIQFSSGTTGQPKPVLYNHEAVSISAVFTKIWLSQKTTVSVHRLQHGVMGFGMGQ